MSLENLQENRIPTQEEISEIGKLSTSIPEKIKNIDSHLRSLESKLNNTTNKNEHDRLETMFNQLEAMKKSIAEISSKAPEIIPTLTGDEEADEILRGNAAPADIELVPDEPTGPVVIPAQEVTASESVIVEQPQKPSADISSQAEAIAQKIKNDEPLNKDDLEFRQNNWGPIEEILIKKNIPGVPGTTAQEAFEKSLTPGEKLQASREEYLKALFESRKNPNQVDAVKLQSLEDVYNKRIIESQELIKQTTTDPKFLLDSMLDERKAYNQEMRSLQTEDIKKRIDKTLTKTSTIAEKSLIYSMLLTGKFIHDGLELAKKGIEKLQSGNGKGLELLKKHYDAMKASAKAPDPKAKFMDNLINPLNKFWGGETGKRSFELGTKEQQEVAKKKSEEDKKTIDLEKKKVASSDKEKTPEEIEKSEVYNFLSKSFRSEYPENKMTKKEQQDSKRAWEKIKDKPVHFFMNPEKVVYKNDKGEEVAKKVSDYSKSEQGLYKKIKDAYVDRQASTPMGDGMTLEQFIKESIKNGSIK